MAINFKDLREQLSFDNIKQVLRNDYGIEPVYEGPAYAVFPTRCHNLTGGSHKLYYYYESRLFNCYTECGTFDIFNFIIKLEELSGNKVGVLAAIRKMGLEVDSNDLDRLAEESIAYELGRLYEIQSNKEVDQLNGELKVLNPRFLDQRYEFSMVGLQSWINEGISAVSLLLYGIRYDPINNCIIIPQYDEQGRLVGVRARYLEEDAIKYGKYRPVMYNGVPLKHPLSQTLYGLYQNKEAIQKTRSVIILEGEKSVLKMSTYYDANNIAVATCGKNISSRQVELLRELNVNNVVLAYDADYQKYSEIEAKKKEYTTLAAPLLPYFNTSLIIDYNGVLGYKDSPVDKGRDVFNQLMKERVIL